MRIANCPNCGGGQLYKTAAGTPANGTMGPSLLPNVPMAQLSVVVCGDCGLTRFFASHFDVQNLRRSDAWVKVTQPDRINTQ